VSLNNVIQTGTYTGNGTSQTITIGWQPAFIQACSTRTAGGPGQRGWATKLPNQATSTAVKIQSTCSVATGIITITATGFTVGADDSVNRSGETYHWWAIRDAPQVDSGQYVGADPTDVTVTLNRQPTWMWASDQTSDNIAFKTAQDAGSNIWRYSTSGGTVAGMTFAATGFTATGAELNVNGNTFHYLSFFDLVGSTRHFETGTFTGTGVAGQTITLGRQPQVLLVMGQASNRLGLKTDTMPNGALGQITSTYSWQATATITIASTGFTTAAGDYDASGEVFSYIAGYR
jgi:hypothetical protein